MCHVDPFIKKYIANIRKICKSIFLVFYYISGKKCYIIFSIECFIHIYIRTFVISLLLLRFFCTWGAAREKCSVQLDDWRICGLSDQKTDLYMPFCRFIESVTYWFSYAELQNKYGLRKTNQHVLTTPYNTCLDHKLCQSMHNR